MKVGEVIKKLDTIQQVEDSLQKLIDREQVTAYYDALNDCIDLPHEYVDVLHDLKVQV